MLAHLLLAFLQVTRTVQDEGNGQQRKTNVLIFIVDDLGIGDIGCYGNDTINTPHIDSIASNGVKFEHNLAPETVCTPSRAAILTGRYAIRSGMSSNANGNRVIISTAASGGLPVNETTYGRIFQQQGYKTAYFGKWHLGIHKRDKDFLYHPLNHGFDYYYGMPLTLSMLFGEPGGYDVGVNLSRLPFFIITKVYPSTLRLILYTAIFSLILALFASVNRTWKLIAILVCIFIITWVGANLTLMTLYRYVNGIVMRNKEIVEQPLHLPDLTQRLTSEVTNFIQSHHQTPFLTVVSYHKVHVALSADKKFLGKSKHGLYGDNVEEVDWSIGKILSVLKEVGLQNDTFVYFTSDHGPATYERVEGERHGGWTGEFKGGKGNNWEGGIRVPALAMWPGMITKRTVYNRPTSTLDLFPTLLKMIGAPLPKDRIIDGVDFLQKLSPRYENKEDRYLFHYCGTALTAVTYEPFNGEHVWKVHYQIPEWPTGSDVFTENCLRCFGEGIKTLEIPFLFDLSVDKSENNTLTPLDIVYKTVIKKIEIEIIRHQKTLSYAENQLDFKKQRISLPRLPCCNFPWCSCREKLKLDLS